MEIETASLVSGSGAIDRSDVWQFMQARDRIQTNFGVAMIDLGRRISERYLKLVWLAPLIPLVWETDATAVLWLGSTALALLLFRSSRAPTFALVYRSTIISILIGICVGTVMAQLINPNVDRLAEHLTGTQINLEQFADVHGDAGNYISLLFVGLLFGGVIEEITFRGFFIGWGTVLFGERWGFPLLVVTSLVFGLGHRYQDLPGAITAGITGVMFGLVYLGTGRKLLPAIATHMTSNFWGITEIYLHGT